jgi:hypothetical protein
MDPLNEWEDLSRNTTPLIHDISLRSLVDRIPIILSDTTPDRISSDTLYMDYEQLIFPILTVPFDTRHSDKTSWVTRSFVLVSIFMLIYMYYKWNSRENTIVLSHLLL